MKPLIRLTSFVVFALTGCGGGTIGNRAGPPQLPQQMASVQISITLPRSAARGPRYISPATQSAQVVVTPNGGVAMPPTVANCSNGSCSATVSAPIGSDLFTVSLFDKPNATGNLLSRGSTTATIKEGVANTVNLSFYGQIAKITVSLFFSVVSLGTPTNDEVSIVAQDAAGNTIVGGYNNPITLTDNDPSGSTSLSATTVNASGAYVVLAYNGNAGFTSATISATADGVSAANIVTATMVKGTGVATYLAQQAPTIAAGTIGSGVSAALLVAMFSGPDLAPDAGPGKGVPTGTLEFGTGNDALARMRRPQRIGLGLPNPGWARSSVEAFPADDRRVRTQLRSLIPVRGRGSSVARRTSSVLPSNPVVGSTASIWVNKYDLGTDTDHYVQVPATLEYQTLHGNIWFANTLLSDFGAFAPSVGADFENAYSSDTTHFGSPDYPASAPGLQVPNGYGDCNTDGTPIYGPNNQQLAEPQYIAEPADKRINVMVTDSLGVGVGGYFSNINYTPQAVWNCVTKAPSSNEAPFIYVLWNRLNSVDFELREDLVRATAHEFQHLINFVNHEILAAGASSSSFDGSEDTFINEGLSVLAQDLAVTQMFPGVPFDVADAMSRASTYLSAPQNYSISGFTGVDPKTVTQQWNCPFGCYGSAYLFQRYLYDRFGGDGYTHGMETSGITGYPNLQQNTHNGEPVAQLFTDFAMAIAVNSAGIPAQAVNPAFVFGSLALRGTYTDQFGNSYTLKGVGLAFTGLSNNQTLAIDGVPKSGFAYVSLAGISNGERVSIFDETDTSIMSGGLVQTSFSLLLP